MLPPFDDRRLEEATAPRVVVRDWLDRLPRQPFWQPYDGKTYDALSGIVAALYGRGLRRRLHGLLRGAKLLRGFLR